MRNLTVQELRFGAGHQENEILLWNSKLEGDVGVFEMAVNDLDQEPIKWSLHLH